MKVVSLYKKKAVSILNNKFFKIGILLVVFLFTFILRAHNYERVPTPSHLDEQLYALSGIYLVETGTPVSWSTLDYPKSAEVFKGVISYLGGQPSASVTLYKPWLDEPPLFSLLVGEAAHLFHADRSGWIPSSYIRFPVVLISALTSVLVFLIADIVSGFWTGILAMLIYGTEPIMVMASRSAMPETLIAFFFCLAVYLLLKYQKAAKFMYILPIPILAGLAGLSKPTGYFVLGLALYVVFAKLYEQKPVKWKSVLKNLSYLILATLPFIAIYIWYGYHFNPEIFKRIISIQGFRPAGFNSLAWFFISPSYDTSIFRSSWYVFCLVSAAFFIFQPKDKLEKFISLSFVYWVIIVMLSSGENDLLAWYRFPALPFLAIFGAWGIKYIFEKADFFVSFLASGFLLGSRMLLVNAFRPNVTPETYRLTFSGLMSPSLANTIFKKNWLKDLSRLVIVAVVIIGMWWNVKYIYNAYELNCESQTCPMVPATILSGLHYPVIWRLFVLGDSALH
ncbi:MAG TPA: glycosyltransferase family 39 protein [Candidatus Saccharimonadales bacterium]|nr:glycosyltransferase family 39 protein [Candidatus Saccharimonadales bacterium]